MHLQESSGSLFHTTRCINQRCTSLHDARVHPHKHKRSSVRIVDDLERKCAQGFAVYGFQSYKVIFSFAQELCLWAIQGGGKISNDSIHQWLDALRW